MHGQMPVVWDRAEDFQVFDPYGNCFIDLTSTIFVANSGHSNPEIIASLQAMLDKKLLHTYTYAHQTRADLLEKLIKFTPPQFEKAFLLSAGTEATECALKLVRLYGRTQKPDKSVVVSFSGAMHGRTLGAELLKGAPETSDWIGFSDPNIYHLPIPYPWEVERVGSGKAFFEASISTLEAAGLDGSRICGIFVESYIGWSSLFFPPDYIQALADYAKQHDSLLVFDEIQSGMGRTGTLFAYEHYGVEPDLICLGKGLSGSMPVSAVLGAASIMDLPETGSMSSTHSANPLGCAATLANITYIESHNLIAESARKGEMMHLILDAMKREFPESISHVFGKGLVGALLFQNAEGNPNADLANRICHLAMERGVLLVRTGRESIKLGPPLTIPDDALTEGLTVIRDCIGAAISEQK